MLRRYVRGLTVLVVGTMPEIRLTALLVMLRRPGCGLAVLLWTGFLWFIFLFCSFDFLRSTLAFSVTGGVRDRELACAKHARDDNDCYGSFTHWHTPVWRRFLSLAKAILNHIPFLSSLQGSGLPCTPWPWPAQAARCPGIFTHCDTHFDAPPKSCSASAHNSSIISLAGCSL